jgi:hypothetical protein
MNTLNELCRAVRTLSQHGKVTLASQPGEGPLWVCTVSVGSVILVQSSINDVESVVTEASELLRVITERMHDLPNDDNGV